MADRAGFDPLEVFVYRGRGIVPRNARRVEVDRSVKFIPDRLFQDCWQLESVLLHEGLLRIGKWAFRRCSSLRRIQIPSTVTDISEGAFRGCSNLTEVKLPEGLESVGEWTFCNCTSLEEVRIPASVTSIGYHAFHGCTNLLSVDLREGLRIIGACAFQVCRSLGSLCVPSSVDEIGVGAFNLCSSLLLVQLHEDLPKIKGLAFHGCPLESFQFAGLSERTKTIRMDDQTKIMFDSRLRELTLAITEADHDEDEDEAFREKCKESLGRAHEFLAYLELKGAVPELELAIWKAKIKGQGEGVRGGCVKTEEGGQDLSDEGGERKGPKVTKNIGQDAPLSHEDCRVKCGAGIVIPEVLKFFTYRSSWPRMNDPEEGNVE